VFTSLELNYVNPAYFGNSTFFKMRGPSSFSYKLDILQDLPADVVVGVTTAIGLEGVPESTCRYVLIGG